MKRLALAMMVLATIGSVLPTGDCGRVDGFRFVRGFLSILWYGMNSQS